MYIIYSLFFTYTCTKEGKKGVWIKIKKRLTSMVVKHCCASWIEPVCQVKMCSATHYDVLSCLM